MSLIVSFNGQFKPYQIPDLNQNARVKRLRQVAPEFNDLLNHYIDSGELTEQLDSHKKKMQKPLNPNVHAYDKESKSFKRRFYAKDIMTRVLKTLPPEASLSQALELMARHQFHHVPIVQDKKLVGIASDRTLIDALAQGKSIKSSISELPNKEILTGQVHTPIADIARVFLAEKINCLPILDKDQHLDGIVTTSDIMALFILSFPMEVYA